jgi:hypothetical protein
MAGPDADNIRRDQLGARMNSWEPETGQYDGEPEGTHDVPADARCCASVRLLIQVTGVRSSSQVIRSYP